MKSFLEWISYFAVKCIAAAVRLMPVKLSFSIAKFFAYIAYLFHKRKSVAYVNLKAAFGKKHSPKELKRIALATYINLGMTAVELLRIPLMNDKYIEENFTIENVELFKEAVDKKKGVIVLSGHLGNWELLPRVAAYMGYPLKIIVKDQKHSKLNGYLNSIRTLNGNQVISKGIALREIVKAARTNSIIAILGDQSGGPDSVYMKFFGRLTSTPPGAISIARKSGIVVFPILTKRVKDNKHYIKVLPTINIPNTDNQKRDVEAGLRQYLDIMENFISENPTQWLWGHKRWKHVKDKFLIVLEDGRAGHKSQLDGAVELLAKSASLAGKNFHIKRVKVEYKSPLFRKVLFLFAPVLAPFIQGRFGLLKFFLNEKTYEELDGLYGDIILSCGSKTIPINRFLKYENSAKDMVIMRPPFPYSLFKYEMAVLPFHDKPLKGNKVFVASVTLSSENKDKADKAAKDIVSASGLGNSERVFSLFVGGDSRKYKYDIGVVSDVVRGAVEFAKSENASLLITASRRTRRDVVEFLKEVRCNEPLVKLLVVPGENNIENCILGMSAVSDILFVASDSISMISEAVRYGKKVVIVNFSKSKLMKKHSVFIDNLVEKGLAVFDTGLLDCSDISGREFLKREEEALIEAARSLL